MLGRFARVTGSDPTHADEANIDRDLRREAHERRSGAGRDAFESAPHRKQCPKTAAVAANSSAARTSLIIFVRGCENPAFLLD